MKNKYGFTIIEILTIIAVIVILVGIGIPAYNSWRNRAQIAKAKAVIQQIEMALEMYKSDNGVYPNHGEELNNPVTPNQWKITNCLNKYMEFDNNDLQNDVLFDPWWHYYIVLVDHDGDPLTGPENFLHNRNSCYIYSYGPDGQESRDPNYGGYDADNMDNYRH